MRYRHEDIFDDCSIPIPDRSEVRQQCERWITEGAEQYNLLTITHHVHSIANPYIREYTAGIMHAVVMDMAAEADPDYRLSQMAVTQIEDDLVRITKRARNEQVWDELDDMTNHIRTHRTVASERIERLEGQIQQVHIDMQTEIDNLKERMTTLEQERADRRSFLWPAYTREATDADKQTFEDYMLQLCQSDKTSASQIRKYIHMKATAGIIQRLTPLEEEWKIVCRFGANIKKKTYQNADER